VSCFFDFEYSADCVCGYMVSFPCIPIGAIGGLRVDVGGIDVYMAYCVHVYMSRLRSGLRRLDA
jgi:hypothetical protein